MRKIHTLLDRKLCKRATKVEELIDKLVKLKRGFFFPDQEKSLLPTLVRHASICLCRANFGSEICSTKLVRRFFSQVAWMFSVFFFHVPMHEPYMLMLWVVERCQALVDIILLTCGYFLSTIKGNSFFSPAAR